MRQDLSVPGWRISTSWGIPPSGQRSYQYAYDDSRQDVFRGPCRAEYCPPAERPGLLEYFGLTGQKLAEFLYAAFAPGWTAYILLPRKIMRTPRQKPWF